MAKFYSPSTGGFYDEDIHGVRVIERVTTDPECKIPADAVEITDAEHAALLDGQSAGKRIVADEKGFPVLADPPPPSDDEMWHAYQSSARVVLAASDTTLMRCYESGIALPAEWVEYRKALRDIISAQSGDPAQPLPTRPAYPEGT